MRVIGTAGHVDHGKSTLVKRLTGIDPDRLAEEKAREMTIDLGFAWLRLPGKHADEVVGVIDVPGHRDFIENMLAGVGGIDAAVLVIAADEGIMPQTREHLAILDLLGVHHALVSLTKIDLIDDPDWLELIIEEVGAALKPTGLNGSAILPVSAHTGAGLPALAEALGALIDSLPPRRDHGAARLPIDRVFTIGGFGTVATGTLRGGVLRVGDEIAVEPGGLRGRVRGLQSYDISETIAQPGMRTAVNVSGIDRAQLQRGQVLTHPGGITPTQLFDAQLRLTQDVDRPLEHNSEIKIFVGAAESLGHVRLLGVEQLGAGETGWIQVRTSEPLALSRGDRFIVRIPSPPKTIGGGVVVEPNAPGRYRRFETDAVRRLERLLRGTPAEQVADAASGDEPLTRAALTARCGLAAAEFDAALQESLRSRLVVQVGEGTWLSAARYQTITDQIRAALSTFHRANPLRSGMPREELRSKLGVRGTALGSVLATMDEVIAEAAQVRMRDHAIRFTAQQQERSEALMGQYAASPYTPPSFQEASASAGEDVVRALIELGELFQVAPDVLFTPEVYSELVSGALALIDQEGSVTVAKLRDRYGTSRKYAIAVLEHLDAQGKTQRQGDARVRGSG
ncbi:MAG: selenocysteine-specific translation elongation factor [Anaerolineae bacterium]|nr:selenocysteine-specific translation elongation factor [Anaerolineae bacterium]